MDEIPTLPSSIHMCTYECIQETSFCEGCFCMTHTVHDKCGKCKSEKKKKAKED